MYKMKNVNIFNNTAMFPYLEGEEIKDTHLTLTIKDMRTEELKSHKGAKENKEVLYFVENTKGFVLNKTNAKRIAQMYGKMTGDWAGQKITLTTEPVQAFGELHNALRVKFIPPTQQQPRPMTLAMLLDNLNKVSRINGVYTNDNDIKRCMAEGREVPDAADTEGWRNLFVDARDYALDEINNAVERGDISPDQVPMPQDMAIKSAMDEVEAEDAPMPQATAVEPANIDKIDEEKWADQLPYALGQTDEAPPVADEAY